jgi:Fic family protein
MTNTTFEILPNSLLDSYKKEFSDEAKQKFESLHDSDLSIDTFSFYTSVSAVFSSKIEGEAIELDSFIKHKRLGVHYQPDYTRKVDDLYNTYVFAQKNRLSEDSLMAAHAMLTRHILQKPQQGKFRTGNMFVITKDGRIEYVAAAPEKVTAEMRKFSNDLNFLLSTNLQFDEVFYFASLLHLIFVKIHPFDDGNGRTARLLEKWFIAEKLGPNGWFLQSERHYYESHELYYSNIRPISLEYEELDYEKALSFLKMLPQSLFL